MDARRGSHDAGRGRGSRRGSQSSAGGLIVRHGPETPRDRRYSETDLNEFAPLGGSGFVGGLSRKNSVELIDPVARQDALDATSAKKRSIWSPPDRPLVFVILVAYFISGCVENMFFPFLPIALRKLGATEAETALAFAVGPFSLIVTSPFFGWCGVAWGYLFVFYISIVALCIIFIVAAYSNTVYFFLILRTLIALGIGAGDVMTFALIATWFPDRTPDVVGVGAGATGIGGLVGTVAGGVLYDWLGDEAPFFVFGALNGLQLIVFPLWIRQSKREFEKLHREQGLTAEDLQEPLVNAEPAQAEESVLVKPQDDLDDPNVKPRYFVCLLICTATALVVVLSNFARYTVMLYMSEHLETSFRLDLSRASIIMAVDNFTYTITAPFVGHYIHKFSPPVVAWWGGLLCTISYTFLGPLPIIPHNAGAQGQITFVGAMLLIGSGAAVMYIPCLGYYLGVVKTMMKGQTEEATERAIGIASGIFNTSLQVGAVLGPFMGVFLMDTFGPEKLEKGWQMICTSMAFVSLFLTTFFYFSTHLPTTYRTDGKVTAEI